MQNSLKNNDIYLVYNDFFEFDSSKELNLLYLPILGSNTVKLYQYLATKIVQENNLSISILHYDLIDNLMLDLKSIVLLRKKLEAIGLLETYITEDSGKVYYIYKILKPLSFVEFFDNPILSTVLENTIGLEQYNYIKSKYGHNKINLSKYKNITAKFSEVYNYENISATSIEFINDVYRGPNLDEYYFDLSNLRYILSSKYLDSLLDDKNNEYNILSIAHLYKVTPLEMADAIEKSIDKFSAGTIIDFDKLKEYMVQLFTVVKQQKAPTLNNMITKQILEETYKEESINLTNLEKFAKKLDNINYIDFINKRYGITLSNVDSKNILKLKSKYNFSSGVLNVLLDYGIKESKNRSVPNFNYLDKIASTWSSYNLISALDAINFVSENKRTYDKNKKTRQSKASNNQRIINTPEYIKSQIDSLNNNSSSRISTKQEEDAHSEYLEFLKEKGIN